LRLARIGVPLSQTAPEGLAAAGIDPVLLPPAAAAIVTGAAVPVSSAPALEAGVAGPAGSGAAGVPGQAATAGPAGLTGAAAGIPGQPGGPEGQPGLVGAAAAAGVPGQPGAGAAAGPAGQAGPQAPASASAPGADPRFREGAPRGAAPQGHAPLPFAVDPTAMPAAHDSAWFAAPLAPQAAYEGGYNPQYVEGLEPTPVMPPAGPDEDAAQQEQLPVPPAAAAGDDDADSGFDQVKFNEAAYEVFRSYLDEHSDFPTPEQVDIHLSDRHGIDHPRSSSMIRKLMPGLKLRYQRELENEHIA
ncbi:hypothetical protein ACFYXK_33410, partial [Streptomyces sp. NPDC002209]